MFPGRLVFGRWNQTCVWVEADSMDAVDVLGTGELCLTFDCVTPESYATYVRVLTPRMKLGWVCTKYLEKVYLCSA